MTDYVKHYKGGRYEIIGTGIHTETEEALTFYRSIDCKNGPLYARPTGMFNDHLPDGQKRFTPIEKELRGNCEDCDCKIFVGDMGYAYMDGEPIVCEDCAPTVGETLKEMRDEPESWEHLLPVEFVELQIELEARSPGEKHVWPL